MRIMGAKYGEAREKIRTGERAGMIRRAEGDGGLKVTSLPDRFQPGDRTPVRPGSTTAHPTSVRRNDEASQQYREASRCRCLRLLLLADLIRW
jgi:hypothetical protein